MDELRVGAEALAFEETVREDDGPDDRVVHDHEEVEACARGDSERRHRPDQRGRGEAEHPVVAADQGARPEEANPGDHTAEEGQRIVLFQRDREDRQRRGAHGNEDERAEADRLPMELPLQPYRKRKAEHEEEAENDFSRVDHRGAGPSRRCIPSGRPHRGETYFSFFSRRETRRVNRVSAGLASFSAVANGTPKAHHAMAGPADATPDRQTVAGAARVDGPAAPASPLDDFAGSDRGHENQGRTSGESSVGRSINASSRCPRPFIAGSWRICAWISSRGSFDITSGAANIGCLPPFKRSR